jgi:hypothetical protein
MKFKCNIIDQDKYALIEMFGKYDAEEYLEFYRELMYKHEIDKIESIIWDATNLEVAHVTINEMDNTIEFIKRASAKRRGGKAAWVVNDKFGFGMGRLFEIKSEEKLPINIKVFYTVDEAQKWILQDVKDN